MACGVLPAVRRRESISTSAMARDAAARPGGCGCDRLSWSLRSPCRCCSSSALFSSADRFGMPDAIDPGFVPDGVEVMGLNLQLGGYDRSSGPLFAEALMSRIEALPGVEAAALARVVPLTHGNRRRACVACGRTWRRSSHSCQPQLRHAGLFPDDRHASRQRTEFRRTRSRGGPWGRYRERDVRPTGVAGTGGHWPTPRAGCESEAAGGRGCRPRCEVPDDRREPATVPLPPGRAGLRAHHVAALAAARSYGAARGSSAHPADELEPARASRNDTHRR